MIQYIHVNNKAIILILKLNVNRVYFITMDNKKNDQKSVIVARDELPTRTSNLRFLQKTLS